MQAFDHARREFIDGWAPLYSGSNSPAWERVRWEREACEDSVDAVLSEVITARLSDHDGLGTSTQLADATAALRDHLVQFVAELSSFRISLAEV